MNLLWFLCIIIGIEALLIVWLYFRLEHAMGRWRAAQDRGDQALALCDSNANGWKAALAANEALTQQAMYWRGMYWQAAHDEDPPSYHEAH